MQLIRGAVLLSLAVVACGASDDGSTETQNVPHAPPSQETMGAPIETPSGDDDREPTEEEIWEQIGGGAGSMPVGDEPMPEPEPTPAPTPAPVPTPGPSPVALPFRGVNLAGAEFGSAIPGVDGKDYGFPTTTEVDYFMSRGMNTFRIGFKWERMQPSANGAFDAVYAGKLDALVAYVTNKGATAIVQPHNFARYYGTTVGSSTVPNGVFADLWKRLAQRYKSNAKVVFNLVNEPHTMPTEQWVGAANAAIAAIRKEGATNVIHVPGNAWTGAHAWTGTWYGTANAVAMKDIVDPIDNSVFEVHQYLDETSGGVSSTCVSATIGSQRLSSWVKWLRDNKKKGFVGEIGAADNATCNAALKDMLDYMMKQSDVLEGWTYWAAGPRWASDYRFSLEPLAGNEDRPRMTSLLPYLF